MTRSDEEKSLIVKGVPQTKVQIRRRLDEEGPSPGSVTENNAPEDSPRCESPTEVVLDSFLSILYLVRRPSTSDDVKEKFSSISNDLLIIS